MTDPYGQMAIGMLQQERHKRDAVAGKRVDGDLHRWAKIRSGAVLEIRKLAKSGLTQREVALRFGVSREAVSGIVTGRTWKHIPLNEGTMEPHWSDCPNAKDFRR